MLSSLSSRPLPLGEVLLPTVRAEYVTRTYLAPSPEPSLIGSFSLNASDNEELRHSIFFVASQPVEKLQPEFLWIHLSETETDEEHLRFVEQADLFGNGQDEVVAQARLSGNPDSSLRGFSQKERQRPLGTDFQNRAVGLFVVSASEK